MQTYAIGEKAFLGPVLQQASQITVEKKSLKTMIGSSKLDKLNYCRLDGFGKGQVGVEGSAK
jgi:hypothetical protein